MPPRRVAGIPIRRFQRFLRGLHRRLFRHYLTRSATAYYVVALYACPVPPPVAPEVYIASPRCSSLEEARTYVRKMDTQLLRADPDLLTIQIVAVFDSYDVTRNYELVSSRQSHA